ncbi:MAG TPA: cell division protein FtsZ, partial [Candidatus Paceibacterota bacterium]|nr:cell division protein FtsZ [Candidatus Paceibacterota bacterium]
ATPIIAKTAKELGALTVAVVTRPFSFEGKMRMQIADHALENLKKEVDAIVVIPNDRLLTTIDRNTTAKQAFSMCDEVLRQGVEGISYLITTPGIINIDFADIRAVMENAGSALMGIGIASGEKRAEDAAKSAINSPLLDISINGAKGVLFSVSGGDDVGMLEIQDAAKIITDSIDPNAKVIFGTVRDEKLKKGDIKITVIATGFGEGMGAGQHKRLFQDTPEKGKIFNTVTTASKEEKTEKKDEKKPMPTIEEDDWGAVPSFLRRKK